MRHDRLLGWVSAIGPGTLVKLTFVFLFVVYNVVLNGGSYMVDMILLVAYPLGNPMACAVLLLMN